MTHMAADAKLRETVQQMKQDGVPPNERAALTEAARSEVGLARSEFFAQVTQGRGKPSRYGTGKKEAKK